jgi:hypothetical protein
MVDYSTATFEELHALMVQKGILTPNPSYIKNKTIEGQDNGRKNSF